MLDLVKCRQVGPELTRVILGVSSRNIAALVRIGSEQTVVGAVVLHSSKTFNNSDSERITVSTNISAALDADLIRVHDTQLTLQQQIDFIGSYADVANLRSENIEVVGLGLTEVGAAAARKHINAVMATAESVCDDNGVITVSDIGAVLEELVEASETVSRIVSALTVLSSHVGFSNFCAAVEASEKKSAYLGFEERHAIMRHSDNTLAHECMSALECEGATEWLSTLGVNPAFNTGECCNG